MSEHERRKPIVSDEIRALVHRSFDESLSGADIRKIEQVLSSSAEARKWYAQLVQTHADLLTTCGAYEVCKLIHEEFPGLDDEEPSSEPATTKSDRPGSMNLFWGARIPHLAAASLMLVGIGLGCGVTLFAATIFNMNRSFIRAPWNWKVGSEVVAKLQSTTDAQWQTSQTPKTPPTRGLRVGQEIRLTRGTATLAFRNGVEVVLQGPVVFEVRSQDGGKLYTGRLSATLPADVQAFHVETAIGRFQLGPGQFGIEVDKTARGLNSQVHVFSGVAFGVNSALFVSSRGDETWIRDGQAMAFDDKGEVRHIKLAAFNSFPSTTPSSFSAPFREQVIPLGNLFDDSKSVSLNEAVKTDQYQAAGETIDLGIAAVHDGGLDIDVSLAEDGVQFNLLNVGGGGPAVAGLPANDTYRSISRIPIRTTGQDFGTAGPLPKMEDGIGISSNELLTFDLNEIREAGKLGKRAMRFVADRAGINDRENPLLDSRKSADAHIVVIVSTEDQVIAGYVDGEAFDVMDQGGVYSFDPSSAELPPELRYDGRFVSFDVPIPPQARFLTLASTMIRSENHDHVVFSGARLELMPSSEQSDQPKVD